MRLAPGDRNSFPQNLRTLGIAARTTIHAGLKALQSHIPPEDIVDKCPHRIRARGGGRKKLTTKDAPLFDDLDALVDPVTRGDPQTPLRWTCKSTPRLAEELKKRGHSGGVNK
ncbi:MAG: hypothetical protein GY849_03690 [Deltaproteobacteria bacterium]|nr:hypothetical protein [Deltaproteobacteria bacterium]